MRLRNTTRGYTLVELLTVIGIVTLLTAILLPVFASSREKARQTVCASNLQQIGYAIHLYCQDYDGVLPYALDSSDVDVTSVLSLQPEACYAEVLNMKVSGQELHWHHPSAGSPQWVPGVIDSYLKSRNVWRCPSDTGFDVLDNNDNCDGPCAMPSRPTMHVSQGSSYLWHTALGLEQRTLDSLDGIAPDGSAVGPEGINLVFDGNGSWHGRAFPIGRSGFRYMTLFADGHARLLPWDDYNRAWSTSMVTKGSGSCP